MNVMRLAEGVIRVADATMERAIRVISVERGFDPRDYALLSFGGAGGMHACGLAQRLRIPAVIVPRNAGVLSALGMLLADTVKDYSRSVLAPAADVSFRELVRLFTPLLLAAARDLRREGFGSKKMGFERSVDVRYIGQSYELNVPFSPRLGGDFHALHLRRYGYADAARPVEIVNLRVKAVGITEKPGLAEIEPGGRSPAGARLDRRPMRFDGRVTAAEVYARERLRAGNVVPGPALILDYESTAVVPPGHLSRVDRHGNLIITARGLGGRR
jgi:N-methylhydantoinase A/oxoprolinase/acetone carboxylase beta subunit